MKLQTIIFTRNRPLQLDLLFRSIELNMPFLTEITVISKNDEMFDYSYEVIKNSSLHAVEYAQIIPLNCCLHEIIEMLKEKYFMFLTDDNVFISKLDEKYFNEMVEIFSGNDNIHSLSLRMHKGITRCEPANADIEKPEFIDYNNYTLWDWQKDVCQHMCWGYPTSINSHVYRAEYIRNVIKSWNDESGNVNALEAHLNRNRDRSKTLMMMLDKPYIFDVMANTTRTDGKQYAHYTPEYLLSVYKAGKRINLEKLQGLQRNAAHGQVEYEFV